jgi:hypothetical protein
MIPGMRALVVSVLLCCSAICAGASFNQIKRIAHDDELLQNAGVSITDVQFRLPCFAAIVETSDPPEFSNYLFVQSNSELNLFSLEDGYLMAELQLKLRAIEGVALAKSTYKYQLQIFSPRRVIAIFMERDRAEAVHEWLIAHDVPAREALPAITHQVGTNPFRL